MIEKEIKNPDDCIEVGCCNAVYRHKCDGKGNLDVGLKEPIQCQLYFSRREYYELQLLKKDLEDLR